MISSNSNPFQNAEQQQNNIIDSSSDEFAKANAENNEQGKIASKKKELLETQLLTDFFALEAHKGHDTQSSSLNS